MSIRERIARAWAALFARPAPKQGQLQNETAAENMGSSRFLEWLGLGRKVNKAREDVTYFTCLKQLAETLAKMPLHLYKKTADGAEEIDESKDEIAYLLGVRPNPLMTPTTFWGTVEMNRNHWGNGYVYIRRKFLRKKYGGEIKVLDLWVMPSNCVRVMIDDAGVFAGAGRMWYVYTDPFTTQKYVFPAEDVIHVKTSHTLNGLVGESVQSILASTVQGSMASQAYMNSLYEQGMTAKATLEYTGQLSDGAQEELRKRFEEFGSGPKNAGRVLPVPLGFKLVPMDIKLTDAQFYELKKYSALQLAAAFGIKPNQLNDYEKSSYANSEQQTIAFQVDTMQYPLKQYEEEIVYKLLDGDRLAARQFVKFNEKALLRTDSKTQMEILATAVKGTIYTPNEARRKVDKKDLPGGDVLLAASGTISLDDLGEKAEEVAASPAEAGTEEQEKGGENNGKQNETV